MTRELLSVQVKPEAKARMVELADKMSQTLGTKVRLSDVARMAMSKGLPALERDYRI